MALLPWFIITSDVVQKWCCAFESSARGIIGAGTPLMTTEYAFINIDYPLTTRVDGSYQCMQTLDDEGDGPY